MSLPATLPAITADNRGFWEAATRGVLALPHCKPCGRTWYPPTSRCPNCLSPDVEYRPVSGRGTLWSWVVMHREYFKDFPPPYVVAFVQLEEGPMVMSTVTTPGPEALRCGMAVSAVFEKLSEEVSVLKFRGE
jgi:uncharacterized OB-fold protein